MTELVLDAYTPLSGVDTETKTVEYQVWDIHRRLVYVGIADDFLHRWSQHRRASWWLGEVEIDYIDVTGWPTREVARWSEAVAINTQSPVYNTALELGAYRRAQVADDTDAWPAPTERFIYKPRREAA